MCTGGGNAKPHNITAFVLERRIRLIMCGRGGCRSGQVCIWEHKAMFGKKWIVGLAAGAALISYMKRAETSVLWSMACGSCVVEGA